MESTNKRSFEFHSETTEVRSALSAIINEDYSCACAINANRLLKVEKEAQKAVRRLNVDIQKGILFQAYIEDSNKFKNIIISKADHNDFIDDTDFELKSGLPWSKKMFKAVLIVFNHDSSIRTVHVYDTNSRMSKYWWHNYLELNERYTDTHNTIKSLDIIDRRIFTPIKKKFPQDHLILRNSAVGYFRSKDEFELSGFIDHLFTDYHPVNNDLPIKDLIAKTIALPEKEGFDTRFTIKKEEIKQRLVNKIQLADNIDLILKDHIQDLGTIITAEEDKEGNKYIRIRSEEGYNKFKR